MKKRGSDTACAAAGLPDPSAFKDRDAELIVLSGLMHEPLWTMKLLREKRFHRSHFYFDRHQRTYDVLVWVANGGADGPLLADTFEQCLVSRNYLDCGGKTECVRFLMDVWFCETWMDDMRAWAEIERDIVPYYAWCGVAAAAKLIHLSARRQAMYAAQELIRDSVSPVGSADDIQRRIDELEDM